MVAEGTFGKMTIEVEIEKKQVKKELNKTRKELRELKKEVNETTKGTNKKQKADKKLSDSTKQLGNNFQKLKFGLLSIGFMFQTVTRSVKSLFDEQSNVVNISQRLADAAGGGLSESIFKANAAFTEFKTNLLNRLAPALTNLLDNYLTPLMENIITFVDSNGWTKEVLGWGILFGGLIGGLSMLGVGFISAIEFAVNLNNAIKIMKAFKFTELIAQINLVKYATIGLWAVALLGLFTLVKILDNPVANSLNGFEKAFANVGVGIFAIFLGIGAFILDIIDNIWNGIKLLAKKALELAEKIPGMGTMGLDTSGLSELIDVDFDMDLMTGLREKVSDAFRRINNPEEGELIMGGFADIFGSIDGIGGTSFEDYANGGDQTQTSNITNIENVTISASAFQEMAESGDYTPEQLFSQMSDYANQLVPSNPTS